MIRLLKGTIMEKGDSSIILEVNNIGFEIFVNDVDKYVIGKTYTLYIFEDIKEKEFNLFGFVSKEEFDLFSLIVEKIKGVGVKTAISIFHYMNIEEIKKSIKESDYKPFLKVKGLGEKTAKRIVLELSGALKDESPLNEKLKTVYDSLVSLGFEKEKIKDVLKIIDVNWSIEDITKEAIKKLTNA